MPDITARPRVIVVDDDLTQLCIAELYLADDFDVVSFSDAREAMFAVMKDVPAVIVSDIHMPGMGGVALRDALLRAGIHVPFLFLSGDGFAQGLSGFDNAPDVAWLQKPMEKISLLAAVRRAIV